MFHFVRDYETVKVEQEVPNEFLLVLDDGDEPDGDAELFDDALDDKPRKQRRGRGAYYKNIERKMILKKKRVNVSPAALVVIRSRSDPRRKRRTRTSGRSSR